MRNGKSTKTNTGHSKLVIGPFYYMAIWKDKQLVTLRIGPISLCLQTSDFDLPLQILPPIPPALGHRGVGGGV